MADPTDVINWRRCDINTTLSGQPTEAQFAMIKALGVSDVINLGPHSNDGALNDEAGYLATLAINYIYIPLDFANPTQANFDAFCTALEQLNGKSIHVHCIYNARVTAFFYRYALEGLGGDTQQAFDRMDGIWRPGGIWAKFINTPEDGNQKNRYAGFDY
jgi:protein tyrosine phosphatase (PTP) superfamily phosphohydrolase (DUF442 family)